jgi:hypothetical protein
MVLMKILLLVTKNNINPRNVKNIVTPMRKANATLIPAFSTPKIPLNIQMTFSGMIVIF